MWYRSLILCVFALTALMANTVNVQLVAPQNHHKKDVSFVLIFDVPDRAHIYGPDSEDSPTNIEWHLPNGVTLDHIKWPPLQTLSLHGHKFQAYEGKVYVHGTFTLEDSVHDLNALKADISYTVCDKLCTPEKTTQTISFIESFEWDALPKQHAALGFFSFHMALMFLFALIGGVILNLMPCVLPILSLKIMTLAQHSQPKKLKASGMFFTLGTVVSFWVLAGLLLAFRAAGHQVGWGFQLQSPAVVTALIFVFFAFALNLFGVFEIGTSLTKLSSKGGDSSTSMGSFFHGVLACIVATPCSAPFMGASVGFALTQSPLHGFAVFTGLALGLSAPYLLICLNPKTAKFLPKPGGWMNTFKTILGFGMAASVLWLMHVLADQISIAAFLNVLVSLLVISIAAWIYGHWGAIGKAPYLRLFATVTAIALVSAAYLYATKPIEALKADPWIAYNSTTVENLRKKSPVLIDFTAKWCITCQVNKRLVLNTEKAHQLFNEKNVQLVKADWTTYDPSITKALEQYGRSSVPLYVLLYPDGRHKVLPELLTFSILKEALADLG